MKNRLYVQNEDVWAKISFQRTKWKS